MNRSAVLCWVPGAAAARLGPAASADNFGEVS